MLQSRCSSHWGGAGEMECFRVPRASQSVRLPPRQARYPRCSLVRRVRREAWAPGLRLVAPSISLRQYDIVFLVSPAPRPSTLAATSPQRQLPASPFSSIAPASIDKASSGSPSRDRP